MEKEHLGEGMQVVLKSGNNFESGNKVNTIKKITKFGNLDVAILQDEDVKELKALKEWKGFLVAEGTTIPDYSIKK